MCLVYMLLYHYTAPSAILVLQCWTVTNETTGLLSIHAEWYVDGLQADIDIIGHYTLRVDWVTQEKVPSILNIERRIENITVSQVSDFLSNIYIYIYRMSYILYDFKTKCR